MIRPICTDILLLSRPARPASRADISIAQDLADTLIFHRDGCVGMAANMIGEAVAIIAIMPEKTPLVLINPTIVNRSAETFESDEGCLCHVGTKRVCRNARVTVSYVDANFKKHTKSFSGFPAQIIQHECDHLLGILI